MFRDVIVKLITTTFFAVDHCRYTTFWCETGFKGCGSFQVLRRSAAKL